MVVSKYSWVLRVVSKYSWVLRNYQIWASNSNCKYFWGWYIIFGICFFFFSYKNPDPKNNIPTQKIFVVGVWSSYLVVSEYSWVLRNYQIWTPNSNWKYIFGGYSLLGDLGFLAESSFTTRPRSLKEACPVYSWVFRKIEFSKIAKHSHGNVSQSYSERLRPQKWTN